MAAVAIVAGVALTSNDPAVVEEAAAQSTANSRPNIVVVMTDDQDVRSMWAMPKTRRLLGQRGTTFTQAFASFPLCCPSRATYLTGQHSHNHGVYANTVEGGLLELDEDSALPVWLREAGYLTAHVGRYLNGYGLPLGREVSHADARRAIPPGWDRWIALSGRRAYRFYRYLLNRNGNLSRPGRKPSKYQTDLLGRVAAHLARQQAGGERPLFLSVASLAAHAELRPALGSWEPPRPAPRHKNASKRKPNRKRWAPPPSFNEADVSDKPEIVRQRPRLSFDQRAGLRKTSRARWESLMAVDDAVARIVRALAQRRQLANTLFVFTSDQGVMLGEHRIVGKRWLYEPSSRVPLIIRGPGVPAGARRGQVVSNVDLAPTILDAAGATPSHDVDGISLLPLAAAPEVARSRAILLESRTLEGDVTYAGIRARGWAYLEHGEDAEELYDMRADPFQLESLHDAPEHAAVKQKLEAALSGLRGCAGTTGPSGCYRELDLP